MRIINMNISRNPIEMFDEANIRCLINPDEVRAFQNAIFEKLDVTLKPKREGDGAPCRSMCFSAVKKPEPKVIFNPPATILFMNGKKYVSKAHNEEFDEEKGLLMCLAKANGITHLQLKKMLKGAKRNGKTSP